MEQSRRDFLKFLSSGSAFAFSGFLPIKFPWQDSFDGIVPQGLETWVPSVCQLCPGGCGISARVLDGKRLIKIEGNPLHPISRGTLCPKGYAGLQVLYSPFRIKTPLKRVGDKGSNKFEKIEWNQALDLVSTKLKSLRDENKTHTTAILIGQCRGTTRQLFKRFLDAYGSPNLIDNNSYREETPVPGIFLMQGTGSPSVYDLENANYILSFGANWLESFWSPVQAFRSFGKLNDDKRVPRGRIVQVEPRLSVTAARSNQWVPVNPGTEGYLALGIAYMLIKENIYNQDFVLKHTFGFETWKNLSGFEHQGFKDYVLNNFNLSQVSLVTGVPIETIISLARDFANLQPALALGEDNFSLNHQNTFTRMAIHSLNGLMGSFEINGGVLHPQEPPLADFPPIPADPLSTESRNKPRIDSAGNQKYPLSKDLPDLLPENILTDKPYPLNLLLTYNSDPVFSSPVRGKYIQALKKIPMVVSFSSFMDETSEYADLILPDHTYLERLEDDPTYTLQGFPVLSLRQPVIEPLYQTKSTLDVLLELSGKVNDEMSAAFPWKDHQEVLDFALKGVFNSGRGDLFGIPFEEIWTRVLEKRGWKAPSYKSLDDFNKGIREKGGWWDPVYQSEQWNKVFQTPSKKFEFYSQILKNKLKDQNTKNDNYFLPNPPLPEKVIGYPLSLRVFVLHALSTERDMHSPWLKDTAGYYQKEKWHPWVEINPEKAKELGIADKDLVWVESSKGRIKLIARFFPGTMPEVVGIPFGFEDEKADFNPIKILTEKLDPLSGTPNWGETKVKLYKA
ncbi:MAG TPA: molybdopterin-dependent oxidoreductase [Terriglobales bacterium]|nr:molybdopterin-dependent oxidoreductase [Terriglobales bacterium]